MASTSLPVRATSSIPQIQEESFLYCPICYKIMTDPVISPSGTTADRKCFLLKKNDFCTLEKLDESLLVPNKILKNLIEARALMK